MCMQARLDEYSACAAGITAAVSAQLHEAVDVKSDAVLRELDLPWSLQVRSPAVSRPP